MRGDTGLGLFLGFLSGTLFTMSITLPEPQAIEVYQGKTTLEYTIRDGEIVDSVVVFKNK